MHVRLFLTFNEPTTFAEGAYIDGSDPPGRPDRVDLFLRAIYAQAAAHVDAVRGSRALCAQCQFSAAQDWEVFQAAEPRLVDNVRSMTRSSWTIAPSRRRLTLWASTTTQERSWE
jgi:beta-glucosidase/6-phospho-beta-glucosidase/beta-galactosidase